MRHAHKLTQKRMAEVLGIGQDSVSRLEQRSDLLISTLRGYVEAMGGRLWLIAEFPNHDPVVLAGLAAIESAKPMVDSDPKPFSSSVVANCSALKTAASQTRRSKQFGFKPTRWHRYSSTSISINSGKNGLARSRQMNAVRSRFGRKMDLVENKRLSRKEGFQAINRLTFAPACVGRDVEMWWTRPGSNR